MRCIAGLLLATLIGCGHEPTPPVPTETDPVTILRIEPLGPDHVLLGHTLQLRVTANRRSGLPVTIDGPVAFRSTAPTALAVDTAGLVTVIDSGRAYIVATAEFSGRVLQDSTTVVGVDPGFTVRLEPHRDLHTILVGQSIHVRLTARTRTGDSIAVPGPVRFRSTDPTALTVDSTGLVSALAMASAYIVGEVPLAHGYLADSVQVVSVCTSELRHIFEPPPDPFRVGMSFPLRLTLQGCGGHVTLASVLTWRSEDTTIVSIDTADVTATARAPGSTTLKVTALFGPSESELRATTVIWLPITVIP